MREMEERVWQRVMAQQQPENSELRVLAMDAQQAMAEYRQLQKSRMESHREMGKKLLSEQREILACLKGLHYLQTGAAMKLPMVSAMPLDTKTVVRRYHSARRNLTEYTARSAEPEWGCVFHAMAKRQEKQCELLAQLLGHML